MLIVFKLCMKNTTINKKNMKFFFPELTALKGYFSVALTSR